MTGSAPGEHESNDKVPFDLLIVFLNKLQIHFDGLPIFIHKAKNQVTAPRVDEWHFGIHLMRRTRKLIVDSFARQTCRIHVA
jgi:hypothetical protein